VRLSLSSSTDKLIPDNNTVNIRVLDVAQRGVVKSLPDLKVWTSDFDTNGKSVVTQMTWEELAKRGAQHRGLRATFIKR
jgi:hypothetical protein